MREKREKILDLHYQGYFTNQIARLVDASEDYVVRVLEDYGIIR